MTLQAEIYPLIIHMVVTLVIVAALLLLARFLGSGGSSNNKELPYESGIIPTGSARLATNVPFYLVAIFFIVFDVETAFIITWAVARKELGLPGLLHITFFIVALLAGLGWVWLKGGLEWGPSRGRDATFDSALRPRPAGSLRCPIQEANCPQSRR